MLLAVGSDSFANDEAGIADRLCDRKDGEVAGGKIAKRVEIKHLAVGVEERVLGVVARCRGSDNHSGRVVTLSDDAVGRARSSTERSQIGDAVAELRFNAGERDEKEKYGGETDLVVRFHSEGFLCDSVVSRSGCLGKNKNLFAPALRKHNAMKLRHC